MCFSKLFVGANSPALPGSAAGSGNRAAFPGVFWAVDCVSGALVLGARCSFWILAIILLIFCMPGGGVAVARGSPRGQFSSAFAMAISDGLGR
jgi:hypothetical protein